MKYLQSMVEMKKIDSNLHEKEEFISYEKIKVYKFNAGGHFDQRLTFSSNKNDKISTKNMRNYLPSDDDEELKIICCKIQE